MLLRALPWSVGAHVAVLGALVVFGGSVAAPPREGRSVVHVRLGGGPPGGGGRAGARLRPTLAPAAPAREAAPKPPVPQPGTRREPVAVKKPTKGTPAPAARPAPKGLAPDKPGQKTEPAAAGTGVRPQARAGAGIGEGADAGGGTGATAGGTDQPFPFDWYLTLIEGRISRNWSPAQLGFGGQAERSCAVHFVVGENGAVTEATVQQSSGVAVFDREALRAVSAANPLPPLPRGFGASSLGVTFIFSLKAGL